MKPEPADCYSDGDRGFMKRWASVRERMLAPLLTLMGKLGLSADIITVVGCIIGLGFAPLLFWSPPLALAALLLHVALDGLDGVL